MSSGSSSMLQLLAETPRGVGHDSDRASPAGTIGIVPHDASRCATEPRTLSYVEAVREATDQEMARDPSVIVFGLDVDDPKAIQGTTRGLLEKYGSERVFG